VPVLWDIGGVHVVLGESSGRRRWQLDLGLADGTLEQHLWTAIGSDGAAATDRIVDRLAVSLDLARSDAERLLHEANDHWHPNTELNDFAAALHDRGTPAVVVANAGPAARWAFEAVVGVQRFCDAVVLSAEVGLEKPDPRIFRLALAALGDPDPRTCVFVDDREEHVSSARRLGIKGVLHEANESTIRAVEAVCG
jgi:HAD superfamily hydrolase (TIGR01509 family)